MLIAGIDPGQKGAIAFVEDGKAVNYMSLPFIGKELDALALSYTISIFEPDFILCERAQAMPGQGVSSMFTYGVQYGKVLAILESSGVPYQTVVPSKWARWAHSLIKTSGEPKEKSLQVCRALFPRVNLFRSSRCKKPDEGYVDALLIAAYAEHIMRNKAA